MYIKLLCEQYFKIKNIYLVKADIFKFPDLGFEGEHYAIYNLGVIEHYNSMNRIKLSRTMASFLRKDGLIIITYPNLLSPELIYKMFSEGKGSEIYLNKNLLKNELSDKSLIYLKFKSSPFWCPSFLNQGSFMSCPSRVR